MKVAAYLSLFLGAGALCVAADPLPPLLVSPASNALNVSVPRTLQVKVSDQNGSSLTVRYYGRLAVKPGPDFIIAALPDSQYYSSSMNGGTLSVFRSQTDWLVANRAASNITYVAHLGDIVNYGDTNRGVEERTAWRNGTNALYRLENPVTTGLPEGIPYGAAVGNHDQSPNGSTDGTTRYYNQYFGSSHFAGRSYYGGHYGTNNDNHFDLFSASGMDFVALYMEYDVDANALVLNWANGLLQTYSNRHAIVVSHYICGTGNPSSFGTQGTAIYNALKANTNLFLMLCGHVSGEGSRVDVFNGNKVQTLMSDYQSYANGGSGYMRLMQFSPSNCVIRVSTYSPWLDQYETDSDSQFTIPYTMLPSVAAPGTNFIALGTNYNVVSGSTNSLLWTELLSNHAYEWFVTVTDGQGNSSSGPAWRFTTGPNTAPVVNNQLVTVVGDAPAQLTLLASDSNGDPLTFVLKTFPTHGVTVDVDTNNGTLTYVPVRGYRGSDRLTYQASDGVFSSSAASLNLNVTAPPDANANGLPDAWEAAYGVTDPNSDVDGDGQTALREYLAGTNPTNAASVFRVLSASFETNGQGALMWAAVGGTRYRVQFRNGTTTGGVVGAFTDITRPFTNEMDLSPYGSASTQVFTDDFSLTGGPPPGSTRYYRVRITQ